MQRNWILRCALIVFTIISFAGCATSSDLSEKYAGIIGRQYRTKEDADLCQQERHQYDFIPYRLLTPSSQNLGRVAFIPAATIVTVKAAKRSYVGGDWDFIIAEVRAPQSGKIYQFEENMGFSNSSPRKVSRMWDPVDKSAETEITYPDEKLYNDTNEKFSIRATAFAAPPESWSVAEPAESSTLSFNFSSKEIIRVDSWNANQHPLTGWMQEPGEGDRNDRILDGMIRFTRAKTTGLKELSILARRTDTDSEGTLSSAVFRMRIEGGEYVGNSYRGFLAFSHGTDSYVIHYQTGRHPPDDASAAGNIIAILLTIKREMVFHR